uniref:Uncharacterized protein n=1 Tax=Chromera velia CCMP2878 TaxID=1169474 RepID=A0A0K6SB40_9ALVE|eukprot:Cvel_13173.t1-p1 / transcript=Cvel_13173.t1 / gene=Cvel_13173 / organism=Chromera_velia_CCMP2878 / gene_product=hypothetical protein / transcript_product=hypothetical protein / location=Cvel_scaffold889:51945-52679(+) / protein_length=111 / sequence_SO=supercontig / SO=protein_coding / is_pseudo=false
MDPYSDPTKRSVQLLRDSLGLSEPSATNEPINPGSDTLRTLTNYVSYLELLVEGLEKESTRKEEKVQKPEIRLRDRQGSEVRPSSPLFLEKVGWGDMRVCLCGLSFSSIFT